MATDTSCACAVFAVEFVEGYERFEEEDCTAQATQEDLLCDPCREWLQRGYTHFLAHETSGKFEPHVTRTHEEVLAEGASRISQRVHMVS